MLKMILGVLLIIPLLFWGGIRIYKGMQFDIHCEGHMKRAADSNSIELATQEMRVVVKYLEEHNMTSGYTSIFYNTPDEDVGFFYTNMKQSLEGLEKLDPKASEMEKSNILMKLRETLLDSGKDSSTVTFPTGISVFPNNMGYVVFCALSAVLAIAGVIMFLIGIEER